MAVCAWKMHNSASLMIEGVVNHFISLHHTTVQVLFPLVNFQTFLCFLVAFGAINSERSVSWLRQNSFHCGWYFSTGLLPTHLHEVYRFYTGTDFLISLQNIFIFGTQNLILSCMSSWLDGLFYLHIPFGALTYQRHTFWQSYLTWNCLVWLLLYVQHCKKQKKTEFNSQGRPHIQQCLSAKWHERIGTSTILSAAVEPEMLRHPEAGTTHQSRLETLDLIQFFLYMQYFNLKQTNKKKRNLFLQRKVRTSIFSREAKKMNLNGGVISGENDILLRHL